MGWDVRELVIFQSKHELTIETNIARRILQYVQ
jgi:hypothetical protein